ncbi:MAG: PTS sugar transporter subunit IIA [Candidatus Omnitrophica bacterium]|nr:PTS sugar transporter subunit IIA [Candidatus Omnitrophota bacterium]
MKLTDFLRPEFCVVDLKANNKEAAIRELASVLLPSGKVNNKEDFIKHIMERERLGSTGIGNRVAIPHAPTQSVNDLVVAFGRSVNGIDFQSLDGDEVNLIFLLGTNPDNLGIYLKFLAGLSRLLNNRQFREEFMAANSPAAIIEVLKKHEKS